MKALDLFGGRRQVEKRILVTIKTKLQRMKSIEIAEIERKLDIPHGVIDGVLTDDDAFPPWDVIRSLLVGLNIVWSSIFQPEFADAQSRQLWNEIHGDGLSTP